MLTNLGQGDRRARIVAGLVLLGLVFFVSGPARWLGLIGLVSLATALAGWCPLYALTGIATCGTRKDWS